MKVVFRTDASMHMGSGHLMRCLTLAEALQKRGVKSQFICGDHFGNLNALVRSRGIDLMVLPREICVSETFDADHTIPALEAGRPDWLVVDHYGLGIEWERRLKPLVERLLVIDDHPGRVHDCHTLIDQNYSKNGEKRYHGLVPAECNLLLGPDYALLRNEFSELRAKIKCRYRLENILVFFTAGDDQGETLKAMMGIKMFGKAKQVDVVVGSSNPFNVEIKQKCDDMDWGYHCQVDYMPSLIANADLVVGAGGSSNWERCALGVPALTVILAQNQEPISEALDSAGVVKNLGWFNTLAPIDYANALSSLDLRRLANMSSRAMQIVDAAGAMRVADFFLSH